MLADLASAVVVKVDEVVAHDLVQRPLARRLLSSCFILARPHVAQDVVASLLVEHLRDVVFAAFATGQA